MNRNFIINAIMSALIGSFLTVAIYEGWANVPPKMPLPYIYSAAIIAMVVFALWPSDQQRP